MVDYAVTLIRVVNGCTIDLNVNIGGGQIVENRVRLKEIRTGNIQKIYHKSFEGGKRTVGGFEVDKWFYNRTENLTLSVDTVDICGRMLGVITGDISGDNLNEHLKSLGYRDDRWGEVEQDELKDDWFAGETVTIPDGDELPVFHNWGKLTFLGYTSLMLDRGI
jgi:hypothetical protein